MFPPSRSWTKSVFNILSIRWSETRHQKKSDLFCWFSSKTSCHFNSGTLSASWAFILDRVSELFSFRLDSRNVEPASNSSCYQGLPVSIHIYSVFSRYVSASYGNVFHQSTKWLPGSAGFSVSSSLSVCPFFLAKCLSYAIKSEAVKANTEGIVV